MKEHHDFDLVIDRNSSVPTYQQLTDKIISLVQSGKIIIGGFLPTEKEICDMSGLSRMTVRKSLQKLNQLGMVEAVRGRGTFVVSKEPTDNIKYSIGFALRPERFIEEDPFYSQILMGVTQAAQNSQVHLAFIKGENISAESQIVRRYSILKNLSGIIVAGQMPSAFLDYLVKIHLPCVLINCGASQYPFDCVTSNQREIGGKVALHLMEQGHKQCLYLSGEPDNIAYEERLSGFQEIYCQDNDNQVHVLKGGKQSQSGRDMIKKALRRNISFTAVATGNDMMAIGAMNELQDCGIRIPEDISVCGIDNVPIAENCRPSLTTVHIEKQDMGSRALQIILERLMHPKKAQETVLLGTKLTERQSTGPALVNTQNPESVPAPTLITNA